MSAPQDVWLALFRLVPEKLNDPQATHEETREELPPRKPFQLVLERIGEGSVAMVGYGLPPIFEAPAQGLYAIGIYDAPEGGKDLAWVGPLEALAGQALSLR